MRCIDDIPLVRMVYIRCANDEIQCVALMIYRCANDEMQCSALMIYRCADERFYFFRNAKHSFAIHAFDKTQFTTVGQFTSDRTIHSDGDSLAIV